MYLVRAGRRIFNLNYMVLAEEAAPGDGGALVVTMVSGREVVLSGPDADEFRVGVAGALPGSAPAGPAVRIDPATGEAL